MTSSAYLIHRPRRAVKIGRVDAVAGLLGLDTVAHQLDDVFVAAAAAEDRAGVPFHRGKQAVADLSLGRQSQAVAILTERLRHRVDEADRSAPVGKAKIGGGLTRIGPLGRLQ